MTRNLKRLQEALEQLPDPIDAARPALRTRIRKAAPLRAGRGDSSRLLDAVPELMPHTKARLGQAGF